MYQTDKQLILHASFQFYQIIDLYFGQIFANVVFEMRPKKWTILITPKTLIPTPQALTPKP